MNLDTAMGTMIGMSGDTFDLHYVIQDCQVESIFWRGVRIARFTCRVGRSGPDILREASL
jgi:hypothetical protein